MQFLHAVIACTLIGVWVAAGEEASEARTYLPDFSEGLAGRIGPFRWARAADLGEDVRFSDETGRPDRNGTHLWFFQFARLPRKTGVTHFVHARNNLTDMDGSRAWQLQPKEFLHNTTGAHNSKIIFGYMATNWAFEHADNNDLAHLAGSDRVVAFCPVRKEANADPLDPGNYRISEAYGAQSFSIVEFEAGDIISYDWFRGGPSNLDAHILCDLAPFIAGDKTVLPGVTHPMLRFDIGEKGAWTFRMERDGRDGLAGGEADADWDVVVTEQAPGARPFTVGVTPANSAWNLTVFSPGGSPTDTSEILVGLQPYDRATGAEVEWPVRTPRIRDEKADSPKLRGKN